MTDAQAVTPASRRFTRWSSPTALGIVMTLVGLLLGLVELVLRLQGNEITTPTIVLVALLLISGSQFTLFAMWFDMESNKDLR